MPGLQRRLVDEIGGRNDGQIALLLCEHPNLITVGRAGSAADLALESDLLRSHRLEIRWIGRGGGCVVHTPGQLAIYPIVPLAWHHFSVGEYLDRLQSGILNALDEIGIRGQLRPGRHGIWGRTGQLVSPGRRGSQLGELPRGVHQCRPPPWGYFAWFEPTPWSLPE